MHHVWHGKDLNFLMSTYMHCVLYLELEFQHMYGSTPLPGCPADVGRGVAPPAAAPAQSAGPAGCCPGWLPHTAW